MTERPPIVTTVPAPVGSDQALNLGPLCWFLKLDCGFAWPEVPPDEPSQVERDQALLLQLFCMFTPCAAATDAQPAKEQDVLMAGWLERLERLLGILI